MITREVMRLRAHHASEIYDKNAGAFCRRSSPPKSSGVRRLTVVTGVIGMAPVRFIDVVQHALPEISLVSEAAMYSAERSYEKDSRCSWSNLLFFVWKSMRNPGQASACLSFIRGPYAKMLQKAIRQALDEAELEKKNTCRKRFVIMQSGGI